MQCLCTVLEGCNNVTILTGFDVYICVGCVRYAFAVLMRRLLQELCHER